MRVSARREVCLRCFVALFLAVGCRTVDERGSGTEGAPAPTDATDRPSDTAIPVPDATGHTGHTALPPAFDCEAVPPGPAPFRKLPWVPSAEDFTFSADGYLVSVPGGLLKRTPYGGPPELLAPGFGDVRGTRFLPDGRLALAHPEDGSVWVTDPATGGHTVAASGLNTPNGVAVHPDGRIYVATQGRIVRIEPDTHVTEVVADLPGNSFDGLTFDPTFRRLYFGEELGQIHWVDLAEDGTPGEPQGPVRIPVSPLSGFGILDGMAMDACGNLYVNEMAGKVWRVRTDGEIEVVADIGGLAIIPALNFGLPDDGDWHLDRLYVLDFLGAAWEVDVGVPGKWEPHLPPR